MKESTSNDRRADYDRRQKHFSLREHFFFQGNRHKLRRLEDCRQIPHLDRYHPSLLVYTLIVLGLSLMDAALTLTLLHRGAVELNPVMRYYISLGPEIFIVVKYGLTAIALFFLVVLHAVLVVRYRILSSILFPSCIIVFASVIVWEVYLLTMLSPL